MTYVVIALILGWFLLSMVRMLWRVMKIIIKTERIMTKQYHQFNAVFSQPPMHPNCRCVLPDLASEPVARYEPPLARAQAELARIYNCPARVAFDVAERDRRQTGSR